MSGAPSLPAAWRVEVFRRPRFDDPDAGEALASLVECGAPDGLGLRVGRGYLLSPALAREAVDRIVGALLADPVIDEARITEPAEAPERRTALAVSVARKPGVMDPVATTLASALVTSGIVSEADAAGGAAQVGTFHVFELEGDIDAARLATLARRALANEVIEDIVLGGSSVAGGDGLAYGPPAGDHKRGRVEVPLLGKSDGELSTISEEGALSLNLTEMRAVQGHFQDAGREPTLAELETIAQTWSEHCQHKTFRGLIEIEGIDHPRAQAARDQNGPLLDNLLKSTIAAATHELDKDWCISVFHDNAGIIEFEPDVDDGWDVAFKVETHNHPSAIDPYGGAGTGIGGVIRDILGVGLGARPIANTDAFFVGPPDLAEGDVPKGSMHPRRILRGVVAGVRDYGNRMGIPTLAGGVWFHEGYVANPLVYAGTVGLIPRRFADKTVEPGDVIVVAGGRTGRDGIHGATFSSVELHEDSETVSASAVQIGDPITEKRVLDGLLAARDRGLYRAVTDCGAGGLSSAVGEMGEKCGAEVDLERVPLKYPGLAPDEIWISEAQERMVFAVPPEKLEECLAVLASEKVEATAIGTFTDTGKLTLRHEGELLGELTMSFLHDGTPRPKRVAAWRADERPDPGCPPPAAPDDSAGWKAAALGLLGRPTIASKEWIVRQYDHEVQGMSVVKPLAGEHGDAPSDGVVLQPLVESRKGLAIGVGANPRQGQLDPYRMALASIDEAMRNVVAAGGTPQRTALLDNFSWGNCDKPDRLGALVLASYACYDAAMAFGAPFISGKDSLNNEYRVGDETLSIPPTLYVSALSILPNVARAATMDLKQNANLLLLVGETRAELGGSEYFAQQGLEGGQVPAPDLQKAPRLYEKLHASIARGHVRSCHDLSEGGLLVAAAEMCLGGRLGADINLSVIDHTDLPDNVDTDAALLFSETCSRFLIEVEPGNKFNVQTALMGHSCIPIGRVQSSPRLKVTSSAGTPLFEARLEELRDAFCGSFQG